MSYLSQPTSKTEYGVVLVGNFINVDDSGVISLQQDVSSTATVTFANILDSGLTEGRIVFAGANGLLSDDSDLTFNTTTNTLSIPNINVSTSLILNGTSVVTSVTPTAGPGISITNLISTGTDVSFTVTNIGVLSLTAGSGIFITTSTGNITISSFGADLINVYGTSTSYTATLTDEYIGVSTSSAVTITLPTGVDGRVYTIKDEYGQGSGKITVQPQSGILIDKKVNYIISVPNQSISIVYRANGWWII